MWAHKLYQWSWIVTSEGNLNWKLIFFCTRSFLAQFGFIYFLHVFWTVNRPTRHHYLTLIIATRIKENEQFPFWKSDNAQPHQLPTPHASTRKHSWKQIWPEGRITHSGARLIPMCTLHALPSMLQKRAGFLVAPCWCKEGFHLSLCGVVRSSGCLSVAEHPMVGWGRSAILWFSQNFVCPVPPIPMWPRLSALGKEKNRRFFLHTHVRASHRNGHSPRGSG